MDLAAFIASQANRGTTEQWMAALFGAPGIRRWQWNPKNSEVPETSKLTFFFQERINESDFVDRFDGLTGIHNIAITPDGKEVTVTFGSNICNMAYYSFLAQ